MKIFKILFYSISILLLFSIQNMSAASGLIILEIPENNELGYNALEIIHESENNTPALKFTHASWYYGGAYSSLNYS
ncbi:MAG: hypothetical protein KAI81_02270, partial [Candidatus Marinimicrobia bacterium]|nr:hypothetical protein [Candidatus Neomarinimicrobiota bacterium]